MHNLPFSIRVRGTIESLKNEMEMTKGTEEFLDWSPLIKCLQEALTENTEPEQIDDFDQPVQLEEDFEDCEAW
jgi:hypothetical protein